MLPPSMAAIEMSTTEPVILDQVSPLRVTEFMIIRSNFVRNRGAVGGLVIAVLLVVVAVFADLIAIYDPIEQTRDFLRSPSWGHPFGTDALGRDMFSRVVHGARMSLAVGLGAVGVALLVGSIVGMVGGYLGGRIDAAVVMIIDTFMSFPGLLLAMVIAALLGSSLPVVMLAVGISEFTLFARVVRSAVYAEKEKDYILASKSLGAGAPWMIIRHLVPNILPAIIVLVTVSIGNAILAAAALGFLGLGAQPPTPEWGALVNVGRDYIQIAPWLVWFPGIAIMATVLGANMLGDGLRDALDPRLRR